MKKKLTTTAAIGVLFLAAAASGATSKQDVKTSMRSAYETSVESSESEIARNIDNIELASESFESEPIASADSTPEVSSDEIPSTSAEATASEPEAPAETLESTIEKTAPSAEPEQVNESVSKSSVTDAAPSEDPGNAPESEISVQPTSEPESTSNTEQRDGNGENFNKYYNPEQQNTEELVLNTNTMKIHHSYCKSVAKIKPENYATTTQSVAELEAQGYVKCKQKGDW